MHSELLNAFSHFTLSRFGFMNAPAPSRPSITFVARRDYMSRSLDRKLGNEDDLSQQLAKRAGGRGTTPHITYHKHN